MIERITKIAQIKADEIQEERITLEDGDPHCQAVYRGENNEGRTYVVFRTDQGNANPEKRCDFLLLDPDKKIAWYIELKGKNHWDTACEQLLNTHKHYTPELGIPEENTCFRLVSSAPRTGMRVFRSYNSYRKLILALPLNRKQFEVMFSSREGQHRDYEELDSLRVVPNDEASGEANN